MSEKHIWLCSDWHFGHDKDFIYSPRGFANHWEMDKAIIENHNSYVNKNDIVYVLGDLTLGDLNYGMSCIKQLKGEIHVIVGNHCTDTRIEEYKKCYNIKSVEYGNRIKKGKWSFILSHYPMLMGDFKDQKKLWCLHGHTHSKDRLQYYNNKSYNIAMDAHNCYPVRLDQIIEDIKQIKY